MARAIRVGHIAVSFHDATVRIILCWLLFRAVLGATDDATVFVSRSAEQLIGEPALADLAALYLGNPLVAELDTAVRKRSSNTYEEYR